MHLPNTFQTAPHILNEPSTSNRVSSESEQSSGSRCDPTETRVHILTTDPQINVHVSLPRAVESGGSTDVNPSNWRWIHCLTLLLQTVQTLNTLHASQKPYKWIRYAIGVVTGAEGIFCTSPDLQTVVDDNADLPADSVDRYYHTGVEERERTFPIDPDITRS